MNNQTPPANVDQRAPALAPVPLLGSVFDRWPWPTDGLQVNCFVCGHAHMRKAGWAHRKHPTCDACDEEMLREVEVFLRAALPNDQGHGRLPATESNEKHNGGGRG